jgi:hypothetical protein
MCLDGIFLRSIIDRLAFWLSQELAKLARQSILMFLVEVTDSQSTNALLSLLVFHRGLNQSNRGVHTGWVNLVGSIWAA